MSNIMYCVHTILTIVQCILTSTMGMFLIRTCFISWMINEYQEGDCNSLMDLVLIFKSLCQFLQNKYIKNGSVFLSFMVETVLVVFMYIQYKITWDLMSTRIGGFIWIEFCIKWQISFSLGSLIQQKYRWLQNQ